MIFKTADLPINLDTVKGFLADDEGQALFEAASHTAALGPTLEVGSYCGKSTVYSRQRRQAE